jgi:hypothetical protein
MPSDAASTEAQMTGETRPCRCDSEEMVEFFATNLQVNFPIEAQHPRGRLDTLTLSTILDGTTLKKRVAGL